MYICMYIYTCVSHAHVYNIAYIIYHIYIYKCTYVIHPQFINKAVSQAQHLQGGVNGAELLLVLGQWP